MSLKGRMALLVAVLIVAGIWALAVTITLALERDLTRLLSASVAAEAVNIAGDLDRDVHLYIDVLSHLAASLSPAVHADPANLARALDGFADSSAIVPDTCFVVDRKGIIAAGYPENAVPVGASVETLRYFREVIVSGKPVIGAPVPSVKSGKGPAVPIAVPLRNGAGTTIGALVGSVLLSDPLLFGQLENFKIGQSGWYSVVSPKDRLIVAATERSSVMTSVPSAGLIPVLDRRIEPAFDVPGVTVASIGPEVLMVTQEMSTTGWMVNAAVPTKEVFAPITDLKRQIYLAALLISLAVALTLRFFLIRQLAPLAEAGRAMRRMTEGEIPMAALPNARHDEIGELIANFNRLVAERSRLDQSLQAEIDLRKQANEALRESGARLERIYQSVGEGIISIDAEQRIVLFNSAAERIFGHAAAEMIGQPVSALIPERFRAQLADHVRRFDALDQDHNSIGTYALIGGLRRSGEEFPAEASVSQSGNAPNKLFTIILRDITERRQVEQLRERLMKQLELLSERLARGQEEERRKIAHELHEQLGQEIAALKLYLQMPAIPGGGAAESPREQALAVAMHAIERIRKLVLGLEPPELASFGLQAAVRTYCQLQAAAGGWALHVDAPEPGERAPESVERACFRVLQDALNNVLFHANASKVWVHVRQGPEVLELRIRDNGTGFDPNIVREENRSESGSLGLFGMQMRAKLGGGSVKINSAVGAGTEVLAVFPLRVAAVRFS